MGRPPCCDKMGVKKGPWTPEEDIMLVSYVQENGPGNWRAVPAKTEKHQDECASEWAAIASYLPERTDNDIKNYWNTHLKKKLRNLQTTSNNGGSKEGYSNSHTISRGQWEKKLQTNIHIAKQALTDALSPQLSPSNGQNGNCTIPTQTCAYASSTENIARLLKGWMRNSSSSSDNVEYGSNSSEMSIKDKSKSGVDLSEAFEELFGFESFDSSNSDFSQTNMSTDQGSGLQGESKHGLSSQAPLSMFENWLLEEGGVQGKEDLANFSFEDLF
ncbi:hypothetical protein LguiB_010198 [Lonicera macranthoides]